MSCVPFFNFSLEGGPHSNQLTTKRGCRTFFPCTSTGTLSGAKRGVEARQLPHPTLFGEIESKKNPSLKFLKFALRKSTKPTTVSNKRVCVCSLKLKTLLGFQRETKRKPLPFWGSISDCETNPKGAVFASLSSLPP